VASTVLLGTTLAGGIRHGAGCHRHVDHAPVADDALVVAPASVVATAAADPGEAEGIDVVMKECVDVVAKVLAGEVVNRRGAGARTPKACHAALWEQNTVGNRRGSGAYPYLGSRRNGRTGTPSAP